MGERERLDLLLVARGLVESRALAQRLVMAGHVRVGGETVLKSSQRVAADAEISVEKGPKYVSRGGEKLEAALASFAVPVRDRVCADVGASTGGFSDCLLQHGAARVYAIDVGHGILHWRLRSDPRVVVMERTNARTLLLLPESIQLATVDASFISLRLLLPVMAKWIAPEGDVIALVKPQFEAGREAVGRGGVVRSEQVHRQVLAGLLAVAEGIGLAPSGLIRSPLRGPKGNIEFLLWCRLGGQAAEIAPLVDSVFSPVKR
jgi:23S rRNA (cytidine1920-2'-O)/16S rRNA (cytidine1409-2'-O)-methyltransferase